MSNEEKFEVEARAKILTNTIPAWEAFKESTIWKDIWREVVIWDRMAVGQYDTAKELIDFARLNGVREAFRNLLALPDIFIQAIREAEEKKANEKKAEEE